MWSVDIFLTYSTPWHEFRRPASFLQIPLTLLTLSIYTFYTFSLHFCWHLSYINNLHFLHTPLLTHASLHHQLILSPQTAPYTSNTINFNFPPHTCPHTINLHFLCTPLLKSLMPFFKKVPRKSWKFFDIHFYEAGLS